MLLTERQEHILKTIVDSYIAAARPVSSAAIVASAGLRVSSATVRHEVSVLEDLGYVRQLHTSGGRVPTNAGYQYYVEKLMESGHLGSSEARTIRHQFHQAHSEMQEWLRLAANIMASRMHSVGLITAPKATEVRLRHLEVISIQPTVALLIVVLHDGTVIQEMVSLQEPRSQEQLGSLSSRLNQELQGLTFAQIQKRVAPLPEESTYVAAMVAHLLQRAEDQQTQVVHAGLADLIRQPEFAGPRLGESAGLMNERLRQMVDFLQQGFAMERLLSDLPISVDVQVVIGGSMDAHSLQDYSFVLGRYGARGASSGFLGIVGPTRMEYPRAVALVRYMSDLMTDLMQAY